MDFLNSTATVFTIIIIVGNFLIGEVSSVCCPQIERILFYTGNHTACSKVPGAYHVRYGVCAFQTCADLQDHHDDYFCGKGNCNSFGCNCDDGCIQLDEWSKNQVLLMEKENTDVYLQDVFLKKYGKLVTGFRLYQENHGHVDSLKLSSKTPIKLENSPFLERLKKKIHI